MPIQHLPADVAPAEVVAVLAQDGAAIIDQLVAPERMDLVREEMTPHLDAMSTGPDAFTGKHTKRVGGLIARSPGSHALITHETILGAAQGLLEKASAFHVHLTQIIAIGPGETAQPIHRDQWAFDFFPFPKGFDVQCNTIWAMTDFSEENGATRVVPGSNRLEDGLTFALEDSEPAEMEKGSVLVYTGSVYHGGGANHSDAVRMGLNLTYARGWLRQEENQYLAVPQALARRLPDTLLRLMGYAQGAYALGYVDDLRDPLDVLRGTSGPNEGFGDIEEVARRGREKLAEP